MLLTWHQTSACSGLCRGRARRCLPAPKATSVRVGSRRPASQELGRQGCGPRQHGSLPMAGEGPVALEWWRGSRMGR